MRLSGTPPPSIHTTREMGTPTVNRTAKRFTLALSGIALVAGVTVAVRRHRKSAHMKAVATKVLANMPSEAEYALIAHIANAGWKIEPGIKYNTDERGPHVLIPTELGLVELRPSNDGTTFEVVAIDGEQIIQPGMVGITYEQFCATMQE